jgi:hypothetical protein
VTVTLGALGLVMAAVTAGPAEALSPPVSFVTSTSLVNSNSPKIVYAACPFGKTVLGGEAKVNGANGQVAIQGAFPMYDAGLAQFIYVVKATEDLTGTPDNWSITASAYCTSATVPVYDEASSLFDSDPIKSVTIECPNGTKVVGMGGEVSTTPYGEVAALLATIPDTRIVFQGFELNDDMTQVTARATERAGGLGGSAPQSWRVTAVVACSQPYRFDGLEMRRNQESGGGFLPTETDSSVEVGCTAKAKRIIAAGSRVHDYDMGQWYLDKMIRYNAFQNRIVAAATRNPEVGTILMKQTAYIICID